MNRFLFIPHFVLCFILLTYSMYVNAELYCLNVEPETSVTWYVGEPIGNFRPADITEVSCAASDVELDYILNRFPNLPQVKTNNKVIVWRAESAMFILDNLADTK